MFRQAALRAGRSLHGFSYWSPATSVGLRGFLGTGQAMMPPLHVEEETYCRQRSLIVLEDKLPTASPDSWVAPNAVVVGDVDLGDGVSVWYGGVLRGDLAPVRIGCFSSIGERTTVTTASSSPTGGSSATELGDYVTVGAGCSLRSCNIGNETIIEDKCVLMEGSSVGSHCILGFGSVLPPGRTVPSYQMWAGNPAKFVREIAKDEAESFQARAEAKKHDADTHSFEWLPVGNVYTDQGK